jgi:prepilin-type N-terminal cleavage/methylation domain-containing protein
MLSREAAMGASQGHRRGGLSLIELLTVLAVMAFLAAVLIVAYVRAGSHASESAARTLIASLETGILNYYSSFHVHPPDSSGAMTGSECLAHFLMTEFDTPEEIAAAPPERSPVMRPADRRCYAMPTGIDRRYLADLDGDGFPSIIDPWGSELIYDEAPSAADYPAEVGVNPAGYYLGSCGPDRGNDRGTGDDISNLGGQ